MRQTDAKFSALAQLRQLYRTLSRVDKVLLQIFLACLLLRWLGGGWGAFGAVGTWVTGFSIVFRLMLRYLRKAIWSLRNRLIVAYVFIAAVPVALVCILAQTAAWVLSGQIGAFLLHGEYERRLEEIQRAARALHRAPPRLWPDFAERIISGLEHNVPKVMAVRRVKGEIAAYPDEARQFLPGEGWGNASGLVVRAGRFYIWCHIRDSERSTVVIAPVTQRFLASLVPGIGRVTLGGFTGPSIPVGDLLAGARHAGGEVDPAQLALTEIPPPLNPFDLTVTWGSRLPAAVWEYPGQEGLALLGMTSRIYRVFDIVFSRSLAIDRGLLVYVLLVVTVIFVVLELVSLIIGVSLTRSITSSVHALYEGTRKVTEGDFSHRIEVHGADQLAQLAKSFNSMTANLQRLLTVEKERERLQAELEIAREVQTQLHPRRLPDLKNLSLHALCDPARMVSGDYYDYQELTRGRAAIAIGDVAGKGISAALLMATLQASLRTQLRFCADGAGTGGGERPRPSTAELVGQLNQQLFASTSLEKYATFCLAVYDDDTGHLTYTNAGHLPPILVRKGQVRRLDVNGTVVGAFPFSRYEQSELTLETGDLLVFYTDGVTEPENEYGEMFGEERFIRILTRHAASSEPEILRAVQEAVREWTGSAHLQDDLTILLARRL